MDNFWRRFPLASETILKSLDFISLVRSREASREISEFMDRYGKNFWIKSIKSLQKNFKGYEEFWKQITSKIPVAVLKEIAIASREYFNDINIKQLGSPPLFIAVKENNIELAKHILGKTGNKNPPNSSGYTTLHDAVYRGHLDMFRLIFEKVEDKNPAVDRGGQTPLHMAARYGYLDVCRLIIENVMDKNPANGHGQTPLHIAARNGHLDVCRLIIENVEDKNPADVRGDTPLHEATIFLHLDVCRLIVKNVKDKNPPNHVGKTPKYYIKEFECKELIELFKD